MTIVLQSDGEYGTYVTYIGFKGKVIHYFTDNELLDDIIKELKDMISELE